MERIHKNLGGYGVDGTIAWYSSPVQEGRNMTHSILNREERIEIDQIDRDSCGRGTDGPRELRHKNSNPQNC